MITSGETYKELTAIQIKDDTIRMLAQRNVYSWRQHNHATRGRQNNVTRGIPDVMGYNEDTGQAVYVEIKKLGDTLKKDQIEFMIRASKRCVTMVATQRKDKTVLIDFLDYYEQYYRVKT